MKVSIYGIDKYLNIEEGEIGLLNIHNIKLYRKIIKVLLYDFNDSLNNEIVFSDNQIRYISNEIEYIHDIDLYSFNTKTILDCILKKYSQDLNLDFEIKQKENKEYKNIISPLLNYIDLLEIEYEYKEELDYSFYNKIPGISFRINDKLEPIDKIMAIININYKLYNKNKFIINGLNRSLTKEDLVLLNDYVRKTNATIILLDYLDDNDVVIDNNLCINEEYGVYSLRND